MKNVERIIQLEKDLRETWGQYNPRHDSAEQRLAELESQVAAMLEGVGDEVVEVTHPANDFKYLYDNVQTKTARVEQLEGDLKHLIAHVNSGNRAFSGNDVRNHVNLILSNTYTRIELEQDIVDEGEPDVEL